MLVTEYRGDDHVNVLVEGGGSVVVISASVIVAPTVCLGIDPTQL